MTLNSKVYDVLKWVTMIVLPACTTAYFGLAGIWGWPYADEVVKTIAVITTLLGALLGISTAQYNKSQPIPEDADMKIWKDEEDEEDDN